MTWRSRTKPGRRTRVTGQIALAGPQAAAQEFQRKMKAWLAEHPEPKEADLIAEAERIAAECGVEIIRPPPGAN
jgi:hypothetical protein